MAQATVHGKEDSEVEHVLRFALLCSTLLIAQGGGRAISPTTGRTIDLDEVAAKVRSSIMSRAERGQSNSIITGAGASAGAGVGSRYRPSAVSMPSPGAETLNVYTVLPWLFVLLV
jgi:hypothetical protein